MEVSWDIGSGKDIILRVLESIFTYIITNYYIYTWENNSVDQNGNLWIATIFLLYDRFKIDNTLYGAFYILFALLTYLFIFIPPRFQAGLEAAILAQLSGFVLLLDPDVPYPIPIFPGG